MHMLSMRSLSERINKLTPAQRWIYNLQRHNLRVKSYPKGPYVARPCSICTFRHLERNCIICGRDYLEIQLKRLPYAMQA
jgi:hypothetical protein